MHMQSGLDVSSAADQLISYASCELLVMTFELHVWSSELGSQTGEGFTRVSGSMSAALIALMPSRYTDHARLSSQVSPMIYGHM